MVIYTKGTSGIMNFMEREDSFTRQVQYMRGVILIILSTDKVSKNVQMVVCILEHGMRAKRMDTEFKRGLMETNMKVSIKTT